jgi:excisionase family DNA binding protein
MPATRPEQPPVNSLLTAQQVANRLSVSVRTVYRLMDRGVLPRPVRYNRKLVRWKSSDIDRYITSLLA